MITRTILPKDNLVLAEIIRSNLKEHSLDIPGTVYFDDNLNHLSDYYSETAMREYFIIEEAEKILGGVGFAEFSEPASVNHSTMNKFYIMDLQ